MAVTGRQELKTALNLKINNAIYKKLQQTTREKGQSKTYIVEQALQDYLSGNVDNTISDVDGEVDALKKQISRLSSQVEILQDCFQGLSCLLPNYVDKATNNVDYKKQLTGESEPKETQDTKDNSFSQIYTTSDLANRFGIKPKHFTQQLKKAWDHNNGIYVRDRGQYKGEKWQIVGRYSHKPYELKRIE